MNLVGDVHSHNDHRSGEAGQELSKAPHSGPHQHRGQARGEDGAGGPHVQGERQEEQAHRHSQHRHQPPYIVIFVNQKKRADVLVKGQSVLYKRSIF